MRGSTSGDGQRGIALFLSLVILMLLTIAGVAAVQTTQLQARMARNAHDNLIALQGGGAGVAGGRALLDDIKPGCVPLHCGGRRWPVAPGGLRRRPGVGGLSAFGWTAEAGSRRARTGRRRERRAAVPFDRVADDPDRAGQSPPA